MRDLIELGIADTQQYDPYEDKSQDSKTFPILDKELEVTPELGDLYVNVEIVLPMGNQMARGQIICWKHDANGNLIVRSNLNPILDMYIYEVALP